MAVAGLKITSEEEALAVLEAVKRMADTAPLCLVDENFPKQAAFIKSKAKRKAAKCTRRAGKSFGIGLALFQAAIDNPGASVLYLALTRDSAWRIMWKDVIKVIDRKFGIGCKFNETLLTATLPNGSVVMLAGADASKEEMEKYLGGKYALIVIDEAGSFRQDMRKLVYENLEPAVADYDGCVVLIGTPTSLTSGLFFDVTHPEHDKREKGWEVHEWNTYDNPYMQEKWAKRVERMLTDKPEVVHTPYYRRMYLGQWVTDTEELCYKYAPGRNDAGALPEGRYYHVLGIDLGYEDATAFAVAAFDPTVNTLYFVEAFKASAMDITDVATKVKELTRRYPFYKIVVDNASKQAVEEMKNRHSLPLEAADKAHKSDFIELMADDMKAGRIKAIHPEAELLADEWSELIWDEREKERTGKKVEHEACENHLADAALYAWRHCYQYLAPKPEPKEPAKTDAEKVDEWEEREAERMDNATNQPFWERDWNDLR